MNYHHVPLWVFALLNLCILSACSTVSLTKEQCLSGNWQAIGYNDGVAGRYPSRISDHQEACAEMGIIPDFQSWQRGRQQGLIHYCTETNVRQRGQSGLSFNAVCPANKAEHLQSIYARAYNRYKRNRAIERDKRTIQRYRRKLSRLRDGEMLDFKTEAGARRYMLELQDNIRELEKNIRTNAVN